ncbi:P-type conjugative transfer ATPase TrbB [Comamonas endophytica]|uniref:P-type conjugative transfer ATPase TrbB n=1 Tax=Comamonas endophytica TaxID=2949090 RepID=A0ABY6GF26_9BURK|nr:MULTISPECIES: P-type conjugative transfer ATPase TrbB [unclassified Acidovorax]MCD2514410.1 P-type conjugative transfer ATPase TrbB [Acidovorax sp. D4N7]UYG53699.1 P-type conjugative transfer ATPase TrbB [Acidovorax sp. 5MLIR]
MIEEDFSSLKERAKRKLERDMGPLLLGALNDPRTVELMLNADGRLWQERLGEKMQCIGALRAAQSEAIIKTIAGYHGKEVTRGKPVLEGEFPLDGSRFAGQLPPVVPAPTFAIRKRAVAIFALAQYVEAGIMTRAQHDALQAAVRDHRNILVIGGTGSGKTTLVNAIIHEMVLCDPTERVFILEDTGEIQCAAENFVQFHTSMDVPMSALLKTTLRMRPDRILVGEVRGAEALDLLDAWNTGHEGGAATLHANNASAGLSRLRSLITRNEAAPADIEALIGEAVHVVVHIARTPEGGRRVQEILGISGHANGRYITQGL